MLSWVVKIVNKVDWDEVESEWKEDIEWALTKKMRHSMLRKDLVDVLTKKWEVGKPEARRRVGTIPFDWYKMMGTTKLRCENPLYYRRVTKTHMGKG